MFSPVALRVARKSAPEGALLHVGCGRERLEGWVNIDLQPLPTVDVVLDAGAELPYRDAGAVYSEHFLEHLRVDRAVQFLLNAHRALAPGHWMRISTPNVDWMWATHYPARGADESARRVVDALMLNKGFRAWGHQFLWNAAALERALRATGFEEIRLCKYGESTIPHFQGIERHDALPDWEALPHVVIFEARKGPQNLPALAELSELIWEEFLRHLDPYVPRPNFGGLISF
jgi:predicted SAM-dependent methyltransferase